ncbi:Cytochrome P450 71B26 [Arabidopsis thaliana]|nr:Cytochrome P450 [Arabidopsis thaliana x Arabidopsis arenosa]
MNNNNSVKQNNIQMDSIWILSLLFFIIFLLLAAFKRKNQGKHRRIPSPPGFPIIGNLHQLGELQHQSLWKLSKKYGPVMLLKLGKVPTVILSSSETAKQVLRDNDLYCCSRPSLAGGRELSYNNLDMSSSPYNEYWKELRKLCSQELFSANKIQSIQPIKDEEVKKVIDSIAESSSLRNPVNLSKKFLALTTSVVCKAAFGVSFEGSVLNSDRFNKLVRDTFKMLGSFSASDFIPYVGWIIDQFNGLQGWRKKSFRDLDAFYEQIFDLHKEEKEVGSEDLVDVLLRLEKEEIVVGNGKLTRNHIKAILMNILLGGIDTSAITMTWAMAELAKNPRVMKKVQAEIRSQIKNKERISFDDTDKLEYLKMVIKETWRLHPPTPLLLPRDVITEFEINGYTIPAKTRLHVNVWAIGRDPDTWKDPEMFLPERFNDSNIDAKGQNFELLSFGSGRRICPGLYMGTTMVEFGLANMLYHFDWKLPEGMVVEDIDMEEAPGLTVSKKSELLLVPVKYLDH